MIPCDVGDDARFFEPTANERELSLIAAGLSQFPKGTGTPKAIIWRPPRKLGSKRERHTALAGDLKTWGRGL
jgi:hypothetical protein